MSKEPKILYSPIRDEPPCKDCNEKFTACHDKCPKDARGEFGYDAWKAEVKRINKEREKYDRFGPVKRYGY